MPPREYSDSTLSPEIRDRNENHMNLPKKFAAVECAYPDAAAAAAKCPKLMGCLKNPAVAVAAVMALRPTAGTAEASDDRDGASMLSMVNRDEPTADVFGTAAVPAAAAERCPPRPASTSQSHGSRGDIIEPRWSAPQAVEVVVHVAAVAVGGRSGRLPLSPRPAAAVPKTPASHPPSLPSNFIRRCSRVQCGARDVDTREDLAIAYVTICRSDVIEKSRLNIYIEICARVDGLYIVTTTATTI